LLIHKFVSFFLHTRDSHLNLNYCMKWNLTKLNRTILNHSSLRPLSILLLLGIGIENELIVSQLSTQLPQCVEFPLGAYQQNKHITLSRPPTRRKKSFRKIITCKNVRCNGLKLTYLMRNNNNRRTLSFKLNNYWFKPVSLRLMASEGNNKIKHALVIT